MTIRFNVQGHRGARGLRPENTLAAFEFAFDVGVTSIETDVHLTRDLVPVLVHDPVLANGTPIAAMTLAELRAFRVDGNPDPARFPDQRDVSGPVTCEYAATHAMHPFAIPTLADLFAFADAYTGAMGRRAGKTDAQRQNAAQIHFDLDLKRVPYWPQAIGDDGAALEERVLQEVDLGDMLSRVVVRSFDHRSVRYIGQREPALRTAVLIARTAPVRPVDLLEAACAEVYCPHYHFVDAAVVRQIHYAGKTILPWTVNQADEWAKLVDWGVDGITTDYPDRLLGWLASRSA
jgi:glycerophosphoryl diester phosphodiesterase